jgi:hypothetical protein
VSTPVSSKATTTPKKKTTTTAPKAGRALPVLNTPADVDDSALSAAWPEAVLQLPEDEREKRVRTGLDSVLLEDVAHDGTRRMRGFVRVVLRVPLNHEKGRVYGVFVEVDRAAYGQLKQAFTDKKEVQVWGKLATRLPFLDDAYGSRVCVVEDGSDRRARVTDAESQSLRDGPEVGPRLKRPTTP